MLEEKGAVEWRCRERFPAMKKSGVEKRGGERMRGGSLLKTEVKPEMKPEDAVLNEWYGEAEADADVWR